MRPTLPLLALVLAACSRTDDLELAAPAPSTDARAPEMAASLQSAPPAGVAREARGAQLAAPAAQAPLALDPASPLNAVPPILEDFWTLPPAPLPPSGLLSDPEADQDDFEEWYAGASDFHVFTLLRKLQEHQDSREIHPNELTPEFDFLKAEVNRRWGSRTSTLTSIRPSDYARAHAQRGLDDLAFRQWELQHELSLHHQERWTQSGQPILLWRSSESEPWVPTELEKSLKAEIEWLGKRIEQLKTTGC